MRPAEGLFVRLFGRRQSGSQTPSAAIPAPAAATKAAEGATRKGVISGAGTRITYGAIESLDPNTSVRGVKWTGGPGVEGIGRKMLREQQVRQMVEYVIAPLQAATWAFSPPKYVAKDPLHREVADFATWAFIENLPWDALLRRHVTSYAVDGFALSEMTDDRVKLPAGRFKMHRGGGYGVAPTGVHEIVARTVRKWNQDKGDPTRLASVEQYIQGSDAEVVSFPVIPADRLLRWTYDQTGANFAGFSILRSAYPYWMMKSAFLTLWAIKHERLAVPTPVATAPQDAAEEDEVAVEKALKEMRSNERGYIVFKNGWTFEWKGATGSDASNLELAIEICDTQIANNVSAGFMRLGLTGKSGSYALGATQQGQYHLSEVGHAKFYGAGWMHAPDGWSPIERIIRLNYGNDVALPILRARNLPTSNWIDRAPILINAINVGAVTRDAAVESALREALEIDEFDPEMAKPDPPQPGTAALLPMKKKTEPPAEDAPEDQPADEEPQK
jgi:hypothetical protein